MPLGRSQRLRWSSSQPSRPFPNSRWPCGAPGRWEDWFVGPCVGPPSPYHVEHRGYACSRHTCPSQFSELPSRARGRLSPSTCWLDPSKRPVCSHHMSGSPVPIFFCAGHTCDISLGPLGQPGVGAHPVFKKPSVFSQCSRLFGSVMTHVLGRTAGSLHTTDKDTWT